MIYREFRNYCHKSLPRFLLLCRDLLLSLMTSHLNAIVLRDKWKRFMPNYSYRIS